jgi:AAA domain
MSGEDNRHPSPQARAPQPAGAADPADDDDDENDATSTVAVTFFPNYAAATKRERSLSFDELAQLIHATSAQTKEQLPWLKLARFGEHRTDGGALRNNANVIAITGVEGDYDLGKISLADARDIIARAGVTAIIYPSPSYTPAFPKWRILCPCSHEYPPAQRDRLLARLNGLFGGVFSRESWTLSQSYYYGRVANADHHATILRGEPLDLRDDLDANAIALPPERDLGRKAHPNSKPEDISETRIRGLVSSLLDNIRNAADGEKHFVLRDTCLTLGGYLHLTGWSVEEAIEQATGALRSADDWEQARKTARWGIEHGMEKPLDLEERPPPKQRKAAAPRGKMQWVWHSATYDFPVERTGETYLSDDGIEFAGIRTSDGSHTFVPVDELTQQPVPATGGAAAQQEPVASSWTPAVPPPSDAPKPDQALFAGTSAYEYVTADGRTAFYERHAPAQRSAPLTYGTLVTDGQPVVGWHTIAPPSPVPLYRLDLLAQADPQSAVLVVANEAACSAAEQLFPDYLVTTWLGGADAIDATDWSPLKRYKNVIGWPGAAAARFRSRFPDAQLVNTAGLANGYDATNLASEPLDDPAAWLQTHLHDPDDIDDAQIQLVRTPRRAIKDIPPRQWAYDHFLMFGAASVIGAPDGTGKGFLAVAMLLSIITGQSLLGEKVWRKGPVAIVSYEDSIEEWQRRFAAACLHYGLDFAEIMQSVHFLTRKDGRVIFAQRGDNGIIFPDSQRILRLLKRRGVVLLVIDPFNNAHTLEDGNSNVAIAAVASEISAIAERALIAVLVLHHLRKGATGSTDDLMGATALRANFRAGCRILVRMTADEAEALGITDDPWRYIRIAGTKENNAPPPDKATWFKLETIPLDNPSPDYPAGDSLAVMTSWEPRPLFEGMPPEAMVAVFDALTLSPHAESKRAKVIPWAGKPLMDLAGRSAAEAKRILDQWVGNNVLTKQEYTSREHRNTLTALIPDPVKVAGILRSLRSPGGIQWDA